MTLLRISLKDIVLFTILCIGSPVLCVEIQEDTGFKYINGKDLTIAGRPTSVDPNHFHRIDSNDFIALPQAVKELSAFSSGINITFQTNSRNIQVKWYLKEFQTWWNMTSVAVNGLDLYGWRNNSWQYVATAKPVSDENISLLVKNLDGELRHYKIYLPLYSELTGIEIGVDKNAIIKPADYNYLPAEKVVIYGSSITQGASASRPGMAYPSIISRNLNVETFNLGFSGAGKMEIVMVNILTKIPADLYILDCVPNTSPEEIKQRAVPFIQRLKELRPDVPILMVESIFREGGFWNRELKDMINQQNESFREAYEELHNKENFIRLYYLQRRKLIGNDHEATIDGTHLSDLGQMRIAKTISRKIRKILD